MRDKHLQATDSELDDYEVPFKGIVEQSIAGICILQDGRFQYVNETFARMCSLRRDQLLGAKLFDVANPEQAAALVAHYERRIQGGSPNEHFVIRRTSSRRPGAFEIHSTRVIFHGRPAIVGVGIDITDRERQSEELIAASKRLQELISNANCVRENERNRVARELHDVIGGMLTAIKFDLSRLTWGIERLASQSRQEGRTGEVRASVLDAAAKTAAQLIQVTQDTVEAVRSISEGLRPGALDHLGLRETLSQELNRFQKRYGISTRFRASGDSQELDRNIETGMYRIFQEALTNVARHSKATKVSVALDWSSCGIELRVADDGLGFDPNCCELDGHLGLIGMQERARELGGAIEFGVGPRSGACVRLRVPLPLASQHHDGDTAHDSPSLG